MSAERLRAGLDALNIALSDTAQTRLLAYIALIEKWNRVYNLTAIRDPQRMVVEHLLDSLAVVPHVRPGRILDVGSGAGLPGIPLAIAFSESHVTLLDSNHKKCAFMRQAAIELALDNVSVVCERVETHGAPQGYDTVVSRAYSDTAHFARVCAALVAPAGILLAMKGLHPHEEVAQLTDAVTLVDVRTLVVPGLDAQRHLVVMTRA